MSSVCVGVSAQVEFYYYFFIYELPVANWIANNLIWSKTFHHSIVSPPDRCIKIRVIQIAPNIYMFLISDGNYDKRKKNV